MAITELQAAEVLEHLSQLAEVLQSATVEIQLLEGVIMAAAGCIVGWLSFNELLRCLW